MGYEEPKRRLEDVTGENIHVSVITQSVTREISDHVKAGIIETGQGTERRILFKNEAGEARATAEIIEYTDAIASFEMVAVDDDIQGQGVGSAIVKAVTEQLLAKGYAVYVLPLHDTSAYLFEKHGYNPASNDELDDWYVRRP